MYEVYGGVQKEEIRIIIDDKKIVCPPDYSILDAEKSAVIEIPTLCYLKGLTPTGACGVCVVEIERDGGNVIRRACRQRSKDGMVVHLDTPAVRAYREERIREILEKHPNDCLTCPKTNGHCRLQEVSHLFEINPEVRNVRGRGLDDSRPAIIRHMDK